MYRSEYLYNNIDKLIDDSEVWPICIPSYNRPEANAIQKCVANNLPLFLFIRREQEELYAQYKGKCRIVLIDDVYDIGTTRKAIVDWCIANEIDNIFMLDDDLECVDLLLPSKSSRSDKEFMRMYNTHYEIPRRWEHKFFKMWMWYIRHCDDRLTMSGMGEKADHWTIDNKDRAWNYNLGAVIQCVHLNIKLLADNNINYTTNKLCGAEDYYLQYCVMSEGLLTCDFRDILYCVPSMGGVKGGNGVDRQQQYIDYCNYFMENVVEPEHASGIRVSKSRSGIPSIKFSWKHWKDLADNQVFDYNIQMIEEELANIK